MLGAHAGETDGGLGAVALTADLDDDALSERRVLDVVAHAQAERVGTVLLRRRVARPHHRVDDAVLLPTPRRRVPLMIGSTGERVLRAALPVAAWWNTWFDWYGNSADGFAALNERVSGICSDVGRDQTTVARSACLLVITDPNAGERPRPTEYSAATPSDVRARILELRDAGADEVILVSDPIDERSVRVLADTLR